MSMRIDAAPIDHGRLATHRFRLIVPWVCHLCQGKIVVVFASPFSTCRSRSTNQFWHIAMNLRTFP